MLKVIAVIGTNRAIGAQGLRITSHHSKVVLLHSGKYELSRETLPINVRKSLGRPVSHWCV